MISPERFADNILTTQIKSDGYTRRLIVNADDFGLHDSVNQAVLAGHEHGIITSTSVMTGGRAFAQAVALAKTRPSLSTGVHLTLVSEHTVCPSAQVPSLVDSDGRLPSAYPVFIARYLAGRIELTDIQRELRAQMAKAVQAGLNVSHVDSHQHLHILPGILDVVLDLMDEFAVPSVRVPAEPVFFTGRDSYGLVRFVARGALTGLARWARRCIRRRGKQCPDHFFGMLQGGHMSEAALTAIIRRLPPGTAEIMVHPGTDNNLLGQTYAWHYHWQEELAALCSPAVRQAVDQGRVQLISYRELGRC